MADEALLSDLCSVCNTTKSKYRCPGCAARTCSLPCYKRHQQWAQCTGKRDPTKYVKRSQLATPAGIDHDFNFLTGVERGLEKADRCASDKGLSAATEPHTWPRKGEPSDKQYAAAGVTVLRAPKGLSRQRDNKTHWSNKRNLIWTVEWIHADNSRSVCDVSEKSPIEQAYRNLIGEQRPRPSKKRKRTTEGSELTKQEPPIETNEEGSNDASVLGKTKHVGVVAEDEEAEHTPSRRGGTRDEPTTGGPRPDAEMEDILLPSSSVNRPGPEPIPSQYHYFLLRPRTSSSRHVLVPVSASTTLNECLRGRTILEFPTIYVFTDAPNALPEDYILEEEYLKQESEDQKEFEALMQDVKPEDFRAMDPANGGADTNEDVDSAKILDVLKQDLGAAL